MAKNALKSAKSAQNSANFSMWSTIWYGIIIFYSKALRSFFHPNNGDMVCCKLLILLDFNAGGRLMEIQTVILNAHLKRLFEFNY